MGEFEGRVALVTGAARGLGRVTALAFAREGAHVVITDIDADGGRETLTLIKAVGAQGLFLRSDVRVESEVEEMVAKTVERFGRLDCAVNNAAIVRFAPIVEETGESFDLHVDTNLRGVFHCLKYEIRQMLKNGGGAIVNQSSITGSLTGNATESLYAATKGGVDGLTKSVALEVAKNNISVNAIAACGIDAPGDVFHQWMERENISPEEAGRLFPIGRMGRADELTAAVLFLCSQKARFIVGHLLVVDGGWIAH
ncbi:SDR family oxidoreductase [Ancylobacter rudongensis]|uniref:NAD(P)-dependent dehydrogenase, short-chain alcohol dehydrogenase family n=1 Tax=Ancylobacter rudongensis TaxID=177413 RepID=A0A1G4TZM7_9HYPH|nr:SDR family oxidoreductase [Ancylobacter rudongensis]SCW86846.1 NAD(P)-dependent dehydrogenase, short-chain alcohol dehydrogenase family [Ancylobacter rudongensis]